MKDRLLSALLAVCVILLIVTGSIGLPIYLRPFYYMHIEPYGIEERTGYTREEIIDGYNEVLDYLTLPGREFGAGVFAYSEDGKSHFEDCKVLFDLNAVCLLLSLVGTVTLLVLLRKRVFRLCRPFGKHLLLSCGVGILAFFAVLGGIVAIDFDTSFEVFHKLFFPGKDNWLFDARTDEIILALPQDFFMHCAVLIVASIVLLSVACIVYGVVEHRICKKKATNK